jgi:hypothetical protein
MPLITVSFIASFRQWTVSEVPWRGLGFPGFRVPIHIQRQAQDKHSSEQKKKKKKNGEEEEEEEKWSFQFLI